MKESGINDLYVIGIYIFYNLIYALSAFPFGIIADKIGLKSMFLLGLGLFFIVYLGMAYIHDWTVYVILFALYGLYAASTESIAKAWITNIVPRNETASAIGSFAGLQSITALSASTLTGVVWYQFGSYPTFILTAVMTLITGIYIVFLKYQPILSND